MGTSIQKRTCTHTTENGTAESAGVPELKKVMLEIENVLGPESKRVENCAQT
jgi:hypothetical protein